MEEKTMTYEEKKDIYNIAKRIMNADIPWKEKYKRIFSEDVSYKLTFYWYDPDTSYEDDLRYYMNGLDDYMNIERKIWNTEDPEFSYNE